MIMDSELVERDEVWAVLKIREQRGRLGGDGVEEEGDHEWCAVLENIAGPTGFRKPWAKALLLYALFRLSDDRMTRPSRLGPGPLKSQRSGR